MRWVLRTTTLYGEDEGAVLGVEADTAEEARVKAGEGKTCRVLSVEPYDGPEPRRRKR